jgi:hypothetical protein
MLPKLDAEDLREQWHTMSIEVSSSDKKFAKPVPKRYVYDNGSARPIRLQSITMTAGAKGKTSGVSLKFDEVSVVDGAPGTYQKGGSFIKRKTEPRQLAAIDASSDSKDRCRQETQNKVCARIKSPSGPTEKQSRNSTSGSAAACHLDCHVGTSEAKLPGGGFASSFSLRHLVHMRFIGSGGFGSVRLVEHSDTRCKYALKRIKKTQGRIPIHVSMECQLHAEMDHPFIARLVKTFTTKDSVYILTELLQGGSLYDHLCRKGRLDKNEARFYSGTLLLALEYLHQRDIVYRDLKPENVILDMNGYPKLIDFGLSKKNGSRKSIHNRRHDVLHGSRHAAWRWIWSFCGHMVIRGNVVRVCVWHYAFW